MNNTLNKIIKYFLNAIVFFLIAIIIFMFAIKVSTFYVQLHKDQLASWLSKVTGKSLHLGAIRMNFVGVNPSFVFNDVSIDNHLSDKNVLKVKKLFVELDLLKSLHEKKIVPKSFLVSGVDLHLTNKFLASPSLLGDGWKWLFNQNRVYFSNVTLNLSDGRGENIMMHNMQIELRKNNAICKIIGQGLVRQNVKAPFRFAINLDLSDRNKNNISGYFKVKNLDLKALKEVKAGYVDAESWFTWHAKNSWKLHTTFVSHDFKNGKIIVPRGEGNVLLDKQKQNLAVFGNMSKLQFKFSAWQQDFINLRRIVFYANLNEAANGWKIDIHNLTLQNRDGEFKGKGDLFCQRKELPKLNLLGIFAVKNSANLSKYYSLKILPDELVNWLHKSVGGNGTAKGAVLLNTNNNKLVALTYLKGFGLSYQDGWPAINDIDGTMLFKNHSFTIKADGSVLGNLVKVKAAIADLYSPVLKVNLNYEGDNAALLDFVNSSPLKNSVENSWQNIKFTGLVNLKNLITIPLNNEKTTSTFAGSITQRNGLLKIPDFNLIFSDIRGNIHFTDRTLYTTKFSAKLFNEPIAININSLNKKTKDFAVRVKIKGKAGVKNIKNNFKNPIFDHIKGNFVYVALLTLTKDIKNLTISSNLRGISLEFPKPFQKNAMENRMFYLDASLDNNKLTTIIDYGDDLHSALTFKKTKNGLIFYSGNVNFGEDTAAFQTDPGLLVSGYFPVFSFSKWRPYYSNPAGGGKRIICKVDLTLGRAQIFGQLFSDLNVKILSKPDFWGISLFSKKLAADLHLPYDFPEKKIVAKFKRLSISTRDGSDDAVSPKGMPAAAVDISNLSINDHKINHLIFNTNPTSGGVQLENIKVAAPNFNFSGAGSWEESRGNIRSGLYGKVTSNNVGSFLKIWNKTENLIGGKGEIVFALNWPSALFKPDFSKIAGNLVLNLTNGTIIHLSQQTQRRIGIGRVLNLFSLKSLSKRLTLNFSDLTRQGFDFKRMQGYFDLDNGSAYTQNTRLGSEIANIGIKGRIGLGQKDYSLIVTLVPFVTSSLPLLAAIAGGPVAGAATWVGHELFTHVLQKAIPYKYSVTGTWENPKVIKIT